MQYQGSYPPEVAPFLKAALAAAYKRGMFYGGRGEPTFFTEAGGLLYRNHVHEPGFTQFSGKEELLNVYGVVVGSHHYSGLLLAP